MADKGKFPVVSGKQLVAFFEGHGFKKKSQKGSHITLKKEGVARRLVIPDHKELSIIVIQNNLKTAGISRKDFVIAMQRRKRSKK